MRTKSPLKVATAGDARAIIAFADKYHGGVISVDDLRLLVRRSENVAKANLKAIKALKAFWSELVVPENLDELLAGKQVKVPVKQLRNARVVAKIEKILRGEAT